MISAVTALLCTAGVVAALGSAATGISGSTSDVARATAKYHDRGVAKRAGYGLLADKNGVSCIAMDGMPGMGAMGYHYVKKALVGDADVNAIAPEALVYAPSPGGLRLAAVEYIVVKSAWDAHHAVAPSLFGHRFNFTPNGNRFGLPAFYSLHAWIWKQNSAGRFAMWNPAVTCPR